MNPAYNLNGRNYLQWLQQIVNGKGNLSHLTESAPTIIDPKFSACVEEDSLIIWWLLISIDSKLGGPSMFLSTTQEIWEAIGQSYSKINYVALIF